VQSRAREAAKAEYGRRTEAVLTEFRGYSIVTTGRDGAYLARITHHQGRTIDLPSHIRRKIDAARFPSPDEAARHARFLILSGTLTSR